MPEMTFVEKTGAVVLVLLLIVAVVYYHWMFGRRATGSDSRRHEERGETPNPTGRRGARR